MLFEPVGRRHRSDAVFAGVSAAFCSQGLYEELWYGGAAAGVAALGDAEFLERNRAVIRAERPRLEERLRELGFWVCPSQANYILFRGEAGLADRLRERGAAIRDCANFEGLGPGWYRAAVRLREENDALLDAMRRAREDGRWR